jgi:hypothetical protein
LFACAYSEEPANKEPEYAGEFFDIKVPIGNYYFMKGTLTVFGSRGSPLPDSPQALENATWEELLLSYEAYRRGITVSREEIEQEVSNMLGERNVGFNWKQDKEAYAKWLKENVNEPTELFENQIQHLLQIQKLKQQVMDSIEPPVSNQEAHEQFLVEHNALSVELAQFDQLKDAEDFYRRAKADNKLWDKEKEKRPNDFKRPGFVSLAFLIDIWRFPKDAAFKMVRMKKDSLYPPAPIYKGYAVFKILENRQANESDYPKAKQSCFEKVKAAKRYAGYNEWQQNLKNQAQIKVYPTVKESALENKTGS